MEGLINQSDTSQDAFLSLIAAQQQTLAAKDREIHAQSERIDELQQQLDWLQRQVFGRKSERIVIPGQGELFTPRGGRTAAAG